MSVWTELQQGLSLAIGFERADELVREARDEHARELAGKLRDRYSGTCGCGCDCSEFIDPEVSDSGA
jgi:hypothetical protein